MFGLGVVELVVILAVLAVPAFALAGLIAVAIQLGRKRPRD
jgi:hypothetical protein